MATQYSRQPCDKGGEHRTVCPVHARTWVGAAQHGDLVAQHEQLDVLAGGRAAYQQSQREHPAKDQLQQPQRHVGIMSNRRSRQVSDPAPSSGTPQVQTSLARAPLGEASVPRSAPGAAGGAGWRARAVLGANPERTAESPPSPRNTRNHRAALRRHGTGRQVLFLGRASASAFGTKRTSSGVTPPSPVGYSR
jgi:hypothetical protein